MSARTRRNSAAQALTSAENVASAGRRVVRSGYWLTGERGSSSSDIRCRDLRLRRAAPCGRSAACCEQAMKAALFQILAQVYWMIGAAAGVGQVRHAAGSLP
jgi:hypothetical protein